MMVSCGVGNALNLSSLSFQCPTTSSYFDLPSDNFVAEKLAWIPSKFNIFEQLIYLLSVLPGRITDPRSGLGLRTLQKYHFLAHKWVLPSSNQRLSLCISAWSGGYQTLKKAPSAENFQERTLYVEIIIWSKDKGPVNPNLHSREKGAGIDSFILIFHHNRGFHLKPQKYSRVWAKNLLIIIFFVATSWSITSKLNHQCIRSVKANNLKKYCERQSEINSFKKIGLFMKDVEIPVEAT